MAGVQRNDSSGAVWSLLWRRVLGQRPHAGGPPEGGSTAAAPFSAGTAAAPSAGGTAAIAGTPTTADPADTVATDDAATGDNATTTDRASATAADAATDNTADAVNTADAAADAAAAAAAAADAVNTAAAAADNTAADGAGGLGRAGGAAAWPGPAWAFRMAAAATVAVSLTYVLMRALADVGSALILIVVALVIALGLDPIVAVLVRRGFRRRWAVAVVTVGFLLVLAGFFASIVPPIATQGQQLVANAPKYLEQLRDHSSVIGRLNDKYHLLARVQQYVTSGGNTLIADVVGLGAALFGAVASALTVLVLTVYFLANLPGIERTVLRCLPRTRRDRAEGLLQDIFGQVGGFVLGNVLTSVIAGLGTFVFLEIVGVPYPLALGLFVAVLDLVPVIGSTIGGAAVTLVALTVSVPVAVATLIYYVAYRLAEDYLLVPRVMRRTVNVPPVVTIVALLIGGSLLGIVGALLAIPAAATVQLILNELVWPRLERT
jgi:predicted PurR-regulated permease PerM